MSDLTIDGAFVCSVRPPEIGTELAVTLEAGAKPPVSALNAEVVDARVDPSSAERSGFEVRFLRVPSRQQERLMGLLKLVAKSAGPARTSVSPAGEERRRQPRVDVDFKAEVNFHDDVQTLKMDNLSLSGALLVLDESEPPPELVAGYETQLLVFAPNIPDALELRSVVVRVFEEGSALRFAVRFIEMDDDSACVLESLILYAVIQQGFPTAPAVGYY